MATYSIHFKPTDRRKIDLLINFVKSLDFVDSVEEASSDTSADHEPPAVAAQDEGYLPVDEINERYPNEWILLADPQMHGMEILGGRVLLHHPSKRDMAIMAKEVVKRYERVTHFYTGKPTENAKIGIYRKTNQ